MDFKWSSRMRNKFPNSTDEDFSTTGLRYFANLKLLQQSRIMSDTALNILGLWPTSWYILNQCKALTEVIIKLCFTLGLAMSPGSQGRTDDCCIIYQLKKETHTHDTHIN